MRTCESEIHMPRSVHKQLKNDWFAPCERGVRLTLALLVGFLPLLHAHNPEFAGHAVPTTDICDAAPAMSAAQEIAPEPDNCPICNLLRDGVSADAAQFCLPNRDHLARTPLTPQRVGTALDSSSAAAPRAPPI